MESKILSPYSQEPEIGSNPEPAQPSLYFHHMLVKIFLN
jgi:hypothetical protein